MSPSRSFIAAGGLTALVLVVVLVVGARHGAFGLGSNEAAALSADSPALIQDVAISDPLVQADQTVRHDDDARAHDDDDHEDDDHDEHDRRSDDRGARRSHDDDD